MTGDEPKFPGTNEWLTGHPVSPMHHRAFHMRVPADPLDALVAAPAGPRQSPTANISQGSGA